MHQVLCGAPASTGPMPSLRLYTNSTHVHVGGFAHSDDGEKGVRMEFPQCEKLSKLYRYIYTDMYCAILIAGERTS